MLIELKIVSDWYKKQHYLGIQFIFCFYYLIINTMKINNFKSTHAYFIYIKVPSILTPQYIAIT